MVSGSVWHCYNKQKCLYKQPKKAENSSINHTEAYIMCIFFAYLVIVIVFSPQAIALKNVMSSSDRKSVV